MLGVDPGESRDGNVTAAGNCKALKDNPCDWGLRSPFIVAVTWLVKGTVSRQMWASDVVAF